MIVRRCKTKGAFEAIPERNMNLNLNKLKTKFKVLADLPILIIIEKENYQVTCYKNGKLVIKNCELKEEAEKLADFIYESAK